MTYHPCWGYDDYSCCDSDGASFQGETSARFEWEVTLTPLEDNHNYDNAKKKKREKKMGKGKAAYLNDDENYFLLVVESDFERRSLNGLMSYLWEKHKMMSYSLAEAIKQEGLAMRYVVSFIPSILPFSAEKVSTLSSSEIPRAIPKLVKDSIGLEVKVIQIEERDHSDNCIVTASGLPDDESNEFIINITRGMDHFFHATVQLMYTVLLLHPSWFAFCGFDDVCGGVVAKRSEVINHSPETTQLDVGQIKDVRIRWASSGVCINVIFKVTSVDMFPISKFDRALENKSLHCICGGEQFHIVPSGFGKNKSSRGCDPFLSKFDQANIIRGYSSFLPKSQSAFHDYFWFLYGFDVYLRSRSDSRDGSHLARAGSSLKRAEMKKREVAKADGQKTEDGVDLPDIVEVMSECGPRCYPLSMLTLRPPREVLSRARRRQQDIIEDICLVLRSALNVNASAVKKGSEENQGSFVRASKMSRH